MILAASGCIGGDNKGTNVVVKNTSGPLTKDDVLSKLEYGHTMDTVEVTGGDVVIYHEVIGDGWKYSLDIYDAGEILEEVLKDPKDPRVTSVTVIIPLHGADKYGQQQTTTAMRFKLTKQTAAKINWDHFNPNNLANIVDDAYIHHNLDR
jgi:hypothetical protein